MAAGIFTARHLELPALLALLFFLTVSAACISLTFRSWAKTCALLVLFLLLGAILMYGCASSINGGMLRCLSRKKAASRIDGRVVSPTMTYGESTAFFVEVSGLQSGGKQYVLKERLLLSLDSAASEERLFPGARISAYGSLALSKNGDEWLFEHGASCILRVSGHRLRTVEGSADPVSGLMHHARAWMSTMCRRIYTKRVAGLIEAVALSKLDGLDGRALSDLRTCGLGHIVAVSGLHVGSAAMLALALMTAVGAGRRARYVAAWAMALFVLMVSSFRPSALRACIMAGAGFTGVLVGREYDSLVGLNIAGIFILCANPRALFDTGFQYSFAAALGLILAIKLRRSSCRTGGLRLLLAISAGAQLGILPIMLIKGEAVPVTTVVANLLVVPLVGFLLMTAWGASVVSSFSLTMGRAMAVPVSTAARFILAVASTLSSVPRSGLPTGAVSLLALVIYLLALFGFIKAAATGVSLFKPVVAVITAAALMLFPFTALAGFSRANRITVLDVGEGDAVLIQDGTGAAALIDGGPDGEKLIEKLQARGVRKLDLAVLSHRHSDHLTGLLYLLRMMPVGRLLDSGQTGGSGAYGELLRLSADRKVARTGVREGQVVEVSRLMELDVLHAPEGKAAAGDDANDSCLVVMVRVAGMRALMTGDAGAQEQAEIISEHPELTCDILKVSHHGAREAANDQLYSACAPAVAAISVGKENRFGHPSQNCLRLLERRRIRVARTDLDGDIEISVDNGRIGVITGRR